MSPDGNPVRKLLWISLLAFKTGSFSLVVIFTLVVFGAATNATETHGILKLVKGDVKVQSAKSGQLSTASPGDKIYPQDSLITAADSRARIEMQDGNQINILPDTRMTLEKYIHQPESERKQVLLSVISGRVRAKVEEKYDGEGESFQIKTPTAVAGVRGTDFLTGYQNGVTEVVTFSGEVEFGLPGPGNSILNSQVLGPGTLSRSQGGNPPEPPQTAPNEVLQEVEAEIIELESDAPTVDPGSSQIDSLDNGDAETSSPEPSSPEGSAGEGGGREPAQETSAESPGGGAVGGDMLLSEDLPSGDNRPPPPLANMPPSLPNTGLPPSAIDTINQCEFCNRVIEDGTDRLIIRWTQPQ